MTTTMPMTRIRARTKTGIRDKTKTTTKATPDRDKR